MTSYVRIALMLLGALTLLLISGCGGGALVSQVGVSRATISPDGDGVDDAALIHYTLSRAARVSIYVADSTGQRFAIREDQPRGAGDYNAEFDGGYVPEGAVGDRWVLPDGVYTFTVIADDGRGTRAEQQGKITIQGADATPVEVLDLRASPATITPNGDGEDDESVITYGISKRASVVIYALGPDGARYVLEAEKKPREAGLPPSITFNGSYGTRLLPNGKYAIHIQARDQAGNVTDRAVDVLVAEAGIPRLEILNVEFKPPVVPLNGMLQVTIKVKNIGDAPLRTHGPAPGTEYTTGQTFNFWTRQEGDAVIPRYYERPGYWRVGIQWEQAGQPYPVRWALTRPDIGPDGQEVYPALQPGEESTITGKIRLLLSQVRSVDFWAGIEQGGVGFPGGQRGRKQVIISY